MLNMGAVLLLLIGVTPRLRLLLRLTVGQRQLLHLQLVRRAGPVRLRPPRGRDGGLGPGRQVSTHPYTQRVRRILAAHAPLGPPPLIYLSFQELHTPLQCPRRYVYPYRDMGNVLRRRYAGMVSAVDEALRSVTYALRRYGFYQNSVGVFSTDNGGQPLSGGQQRTAEGPQGHLYWEGGVRVRGFFHIPLLRRRRRPRAGGGLPAGGGFGIWDTAVQASIRPGDWKLLPGDPGYGDRSPPPVLPGGWWGPERHSQRFDRAERQPDVVKLLLARLANRRPTAFIRPLPLRASSSGAERTHTRPHWSPASAWGL
ncbi:unnamed protein product [Gadus morhua 'NCC']